MSNSKITYLRYDMIGAYNSGVTIHPQKNMENLGLNVISGEGVPLADAWFIECAGVDVEKLPDYINVFDGKPGWWQ